MEFQNAVSIRDDYIQQLTESLQQALVHRKDLQNQCEEYAKEIVELHQQLAGATGIVKNLKCHTDSEVISDNASENDQLNSLSDVPSNIREFLERYIKKKSTEIEEDYQKEIEELKVIFK